MRRCEKGKPCGATCIERRDICRKDSPGTISTALGKARNELVEVRNQKKRGVGQSLDGESLDVSKLVSRVDKWVEKHGLGKPSLFGGLDPESTLRTLTEYYKHDSIHVLLKDYLGKSSQQITRLSGNVGKGPSITEELFVEAVQDILKSKPEAGFNWKERSQVLNILSSPETKTNLIRRITSFKEYFNQLDEKSPLYVNRDRVSYGVLRILKKAAERPDFYQFLNTILYAHENFRDILEEKIIK